MQPSNQLLEKLSRAIRANKNICLPSYLSGVESLYDRLNTALSFVSGDSVDVIPLRAFLDRGRREDVIGSLRRWLQHDGRTIEDWVQAQSAYTRNVCVTINGVSACDSLIHDEIFDTMVTPCVDALGIPLRPFDAYAFCGTYDITPFGVHTDDEGSLLLHVGPAPKLVYSWPSAETQTRIWQDYLRNHQFNIDRAPEPPEVNILYPGDVIFIPAHTPHAMSNFSFSMTIGLILNPFDCKALAKDFASDIIRRSFSPDRTTMFESAKEAFLAAAPQLDAVASDVRSFPSFMDMMARMESNGWLVPSPWWRREPQKSAKYVADKRYPISIALASAEPTVYVRGFEVGLPLGEWSQQLLDVLHNCHHGDTLEGFVRTLPPADRQRALALLKCLVTLGGIKLTSELVQYA